MSFTGSILDNVMSFYPVLFFSKVFIYSIERDVYLQYFFRKFEFLKTKPLNCFYGNVSNITNSHWFLNENDQNCFMTII